MTGLMSSIQINQNKSKIEELEGQISKMMDRIDKLEKELSEFRKFVQTRRIGYG